MSQDDNSPMADAQYRRGSRELKAIIAVVVLVLLISFGWRLATGRPGGRESQLGATPAAQPNGAAATAPAAGAGVTTTKPADASTAPRPAG